MAETIKTNKYQPEDRFPVMVFFSLDDIGRKGVFLPTVTGGLKH